MRQTRLILAALLGAAFLAAASTGPARSSAATDARCLPVEKTSTRVAQVRVDEPPLSYSVNVQGDAIERGRPVDVRLVIRNVGTTPAALSFSSSQVYDIVVWNDQCAEVWRWSRGQAFAQVITSPSVQPCCPIFHHIRWFRRDQAGRPVAPGTYEARVVFLGQSATRQAPLVFAPLIFELQ